MADDSKQPEQEEEEEVIQPSFKLSYFAFAGRAASLRLAAFVGNVSYTDAFVTKQEHETTKKANARRWSGLPECTLYSKENKEVLTIGQSNTILRYIGSVSTPVMYPANALLAALCDEVLDSCEDTKAAILGGLATEQDRQKLVSKEGALTYWLGKFELRLQENAKRNGGDDNAGYVVGNELTIADLKLFELFHGLWLIFESYEDVKVEELVAAYPAIQKHYALVKSNDAVQEFLQKFSLRNSEFKADPDDEDIKTQTYKGTFVPAAL